MGLEKETSSSSYSLPPCLHEDSPLIAEEASPLSSNFKTFANIFISIVGAGVLGLPYCFKRTGWILGLLMLFTVAILTYHCMMLLVHTRRKLDSFMCFSKINSFGDLGFAICGPVGRFSVDAMIVLSQAGFCVSYLIFKAKTLGYVVGHKASDPILGLTPKVLFIWGCFPFQLGLNSIPTLTHLAPLSIVADAVDVAAKSVVMVEDVLTFRKNRPTLEASGGFSVLFYGLGVAVYAFEGIGMVLPLESEAKEKEKFGSVLALGMAVISVLFGAFGALGYFAFGEETKDVFTTNLGKGLVSTLVQLGLCINLFITFSLMMNAVYEVVERSFCESRYCL